MLSKDNSERIWSIAQIKPNSYDRAIRNLERQGFEVFLPKIIKTIRHNNKFVHKDHYVFPGYMFVGFNQDFREWVKINSTYGVSKVLVFNNKPSEINHDLILALKDRYEINRNSTLKEELQAGDNIKLNSGPFSDLLLKVDATEGKDRIWVLLEFLGSQKRIKLTNINKRSYIKI
jgi:transcriptional antiterminator RfaH